ncbi:inositol polyphosphate 5-phosphatase OCRL-like [Topomyia yanbarensis]|uniref:inositol polyphosphate 5-phosphatase OCRL-like n=1 Tax=Topomyia yanbarensis TaxID=2498891 RepID=UPI00273AFBA7|nr:inositol polyphosphate 5-phosphatase OCRL-like [Topomyia yanbarensis]XP_058831687.1 inositol polyphosphate 5-phosphatase OCRL-like [Topomyia yanbarensis]XP_058838980.1 inositol polyphosphate 5-phosphatase OCRL-like [Topomyia yanbarensis]XP_058838981.1 inositol polyphosphate 5-phosphatase OCRL-like [Topomyia yanbarensis]
MNPGNYESTIITTVTQKFREGESILAIFEGYQIVGNKHQNRLLVIASSNYTSALFAFSIASYPPESISDLTIAAVYPIDDSFWVNPESGTPGSISSHQFTIFSQKAPTVYFYQATPDTIVSRDNFISNLKHLISSYKSASTQAAATSCPLDFKWLENYKRADMLAIDRNIADGSQAPKTRDSKFKEELDRRRHEYIVYEPYKIYTATWNVNGQTSEDIELPEWLSTTDDPPDIYAVGFQEIEWTPEKIIMNETKIDRTWVNKVMMGLHKGAAYEELASVRLVGMMLTVAVKKSLRDQISDCLTAAVGTGTLKWGNKGGVGVSFQLNEALLCFVNSHLAAHTQEVDRRNEDHDEIIRRMSFEKTFRGRAIDEHHHIFWIGDLNYRLNSDITQEFVNCKDRDYNQLYAYDQLYVEKGKKRIFREYKEGKILFGPTYKYNPGTDDWDSSEKSRCPAWCDRILWKGLRTELLKYDSVMQLRRSDHKPVFAVFNVEVETKDDQKFKKVHEEVLKTVDKYENDNQPQITVEQTDLDFGLIRFNEKYSRELLVANNCHLPVRFRFAAKDDRSSYVCEDFIHISHKAGELITGNSLSIRIDIFVDAKAASHMLHKLKDAKAGVKIPLDILVLHVENGRDIFITIFGEYKQSCFGVSLETLMKLNKPIFEYDINELVALEKEEKLIDLTGEEELKIPREIWRLTDYLYKNGMDNPQLFTLNRTHSKHENILEIRDWLDSWSSEPFPGIPKTAAEALLILLESLPEPVVTISERECMVNADNYERCRELIRTKLKPVHRLVFLYICMFLIELRRQNPSIRLEILATIFGRILIRSQTPLVRTPTGNDVYAYTEGERDQRRRFMMTFLTSKIQEFARAEIDSNGV